jgi:hypothetical protein
MARRKPAICWTECAHPYGDDMYSSKCASGVCGTAFSDRATAAAPWHRDLYIHRLIVDSNNVRILCKTATRWCHLLGTFSNGLLPSCFVPGWAISTQVWTTCWSQCYHDCPLDGDSLLCAASCRGPQRSDCEAVSATLKVPVLACCSGLLWRADPDLLTVGRFYRPSISLVFRMTLRALASAFACRASCTKQLLLSVLAHA